MATKTKKRKPGRPKTREPRARQGYLPEMEPPRIKVLDDAAEIYYDRMLDRKAANKIEKEAKVDLIEKMKAEGLAIYLTPDGLEVTVTGKSQVTCRPKKDQSNGDGKE